METAVWFVLYFLIYVLFVGCFISRVWSADPRELFWLAAGHSLALSRPRLHIAAIGCARGRGRFPPIRQEVAGLGGDDDAGDSSQSPSHHVSLRKITALPTVRTDKDFWTQCINKLYHFNKHSKLPHFVLTDTFGLRHHNASYNASSTSFWNIFFSSVVLFLPPVPKWQNHLLMFRFQKPISGRWRALGLLVAC